MTDYHTQIIESKPLRDQVADIVRGMILSGELKAGEQISERNIGQMLNVSTTPVKEAFRSLQAEGLIYTRPRRGSFVAEISIDSMLQIAFMRSSLEGVAAYYAALTITDEQVKELRSILNTSEILLASGDLEGNINEKIHQYNMLFHSNIRKVCGNSYLNNQIETLRTIDYRFRKISHMEYIEEPVAAHQEHKAILEALNDRDPVLSEQRMVSHIRRVATFVVDYAKKLY